MTHIRQQISSLFSKHINVLVPSHKNGNLNNINILFIYLLALYLIKLKLLQKTLKKLSTSKYSSKMAVKGPHRPSSQAATLMSH